LVNIMAMKELCPICIEMDARSFLNKIIEFGFEFKTVDDIVDALKLFGAQESYVHLRAVAQKLWEEYL
jgi:hypothetical protein